MASALFSLGSQTHWPHFWPPCIQESDYKLLDKENARDSVMIPEFDDEAEHSQDTAAWNSPDI